MKFRIAATAVYVSLMVAAGSAAAQGADRDRQAIIEEAVLFLAAEHDLSLDRVFLDTVRTGRVMSRQAFEHRHRGVSVALMRASANRLGFGLVDRDGIGACFALPGVIEGPCRVPDPGIAIFVHAIEIEGDQATASVNYSLRRSDIPMCGKSGMMRFEFRREGPRWRVATAREEAHGHPSRCLPPDSLPGGG